MFLKLLKSTLCLNLQRSKPRLIILIFGLYQHKGRSVCALVKEFRPFVPEVARTRLFHHHFSSPEQRSTEQQTPASPGVAGLARLAHSVHQPFPLPRLCHPECTHDPVCLLRRVDGARTMETNPAKRQEKWGKPPFLAERPNPKTIPPHPSCLIIPLLLLSKMASGNIEIIQFY